MSLEADQNSGDYAGLTGSVSVSVTDDEIPTVTLLLSQAPISEKRWFFHGDGDPEPDFKARTRRSTSRRRRGSLRRIATSIRPGIELTIAKGQKTSTGSVTIVAVDNNVDSLNKTVVVSAVAENSKGVNDPAPRVLGITDDDDTPTVTLHLGDEDGSISEGRSTTVWATLSHPARARTTLTLSTEGDSVSLTDNQGDVQTVLTIEPFQVTSDTLTIVSVDDNIDEPKRTVKISATVSNNVDGLAAPSPPKDVTLEVTDNDAKPTLAIELDTNVIGENGGVAKVTAKLTGRRRIERGDNDHDLCDRGWLHAGWHDSDDRGRQDRQRRPASNDHWREQRR